MKIGISSETTIDLSKELLEEFDIKTVPFTILLGDETKQDGVLTPQEIFDFVDRSGVLPKTSAVNEEQYREFFRNLLKEYDEVIHIAFSSELSCACNNAYRVAQEEEFSKVHVIDSKALSTGIACLAIYARKLANEGKSVQEIIDVINARIPYVQTSLVTSTIDYLFKGGRCSALSAFGAQLFKIKPEVYLVDGKMVPGKKFVGKQTSVVEQYCNSILERFNNPDLSIAFVTHSAATPEMVEIAKNKLKERGFKKIYETTAGCTITSHCGPKCIGILYINDGGVK